MIVILFDPAKGTVVNMAEPVADGAGTLNILGMFTVGDFPQLFSKSNLMALIIFTILFGTCSSAATLPVNMQHAREIGIPEDVTDVAVPLGASLHKDGSCMVIIMKIALMCGLSGIRYATPGNIFMSVVVAVIAAVVVGGVPAGGYAGIFFVLSVFDFDPAVAVPVMVLLTTITDAVTTAINVTGDTGLAMIIARVTDGRDWFRKAQEKKKEEKAQENLYSV